MATQQQQQQEQDNNRAPNLIKKIEKTQRKTDVLLEPFDYLCQNPGKNIRTKLMQAFNLWLKVPEDKLRAIAEVVEMLHTASLLIDDIEDSSLLRRGVPVAHQVFGVPSTINCANYVYFLALEKVLQIGNPQLVKICTEELCNLHRGQGMDLYWRDKNVCPTEMEYLEMILNKTGGLLRLGVKMMQVFAAPSSRDLVPLVNALAIHFQVRDDYINLQSDQYMKGKGFCEDLTEGKFSFPVIHCVQRDDQNQMMNILKLKTTDESILRFAVDCMRERGSFEYTLSHLLRFEDQARKEIEKLGGNRDLSRILDSLSHEYKPKSNL